MVRIGVASHKDFDDSVLPDCYRVIKVGDVYPSSVARDRDWDLDDDVSPNIHDQNPWYCELTAHYYIWKKWVSEQDVVGLVHYRRLFVDYHRSSNDLADDVLDAEGIGEMLRSKKIILPFRSFKRRGQNTLRRGSYWNEIHEVVSMVSPTYVEAYEQVAESSITTFGNRLIATSDLFEEYSEWLFAILAAYDKTKEERGEQREARVDGYISELLLNAWVCKNLTERDICRCASIHTESESGFDPYKGGLLGACARFAYSRPSTLGPIQLLATFGRRIVS